jgi:hypothetical protein
MWIYLLLLWPIVGWVRLYLAYEEMKRRSKATVTLDMQAVIMAAVFPFFSK